MSSKLNIPLALLKDLRRNALHKHPETAGKEEETAKRIVGFLKSFNPNTVIENIGGFGVAAVFKRFDSGPTIVIRCELDALPIQESNVFAHKSQNAGVSHKCGHDGHMAIVAGLATLLSKKRPKTGRVVLLFQPAEENGQGAKAVLNDKHFTDLNPDYVFALHNLPGYKKGTVVLKEGTFTAAVHSLKVELFGKTAHAGEPQFGVNPAMAIAELIQVFNSWNINDATNPDFTLITPIQIQMGDSAYGVSAGSGFASFTLRCASNAQMVELEKKAATFANALAVKHGLKAVLSWHEGFSANENDTSCVQAIREACKIEGIKVQDKKEPFTWGEDFGLFTANYKGAMFGIGAGEKCPALHNPDYDFPDELIDPAIRVFYQTILQFIDV